MKIILRIQTSRYQGVKQQKQIQISVQKLVLGTPSDVRCIRQFVEVRIKKSLIFNIIYCCNIVYFYYLNYIF